jgi:hypothetical protein
MGKPVSKDEVLTARGFGGRSVRALLSTIGDAKREHNKPTSEVIDARMADFSAARRKLGEDDDARVLAHSLMASYRREFASGGPRGFLQAIGRRTGLLYPHFGGATLHKRVRPSVPILDVLVRSCIRSGEAIPLAEFLERLWTRFGLIVGGRRGEDWDDAVVLSESNILLDMGAMHENTDRFVDEIVAMGLGRRYPDDVTFIGEAYVA